MVCNEVEPITFPSVLEMACDVIKWATPWHQNTIVWEFKHNWGQPGWKELAEFLCKTILSSHISELRSQTLQNVKRVNYNFGCFIFWGIFQRKLQQLTEDKYY